MKRMSCHPHLGISAASRLIFSLGVDMSTEGPVTQLSAAFLSPIEEEEEETVLLNCWKIVSWCGSCTRFQVPLQRSSALVYIRTTSINHPSLLSSIILRWPSTSGKDAKCSPFIHLTGTAAKQCHPAWQPSNPGCNGNK